jgi:hypothetical protein
MTPLFRVASEEEWRNAEFHVKYPDIHPCLMALCDAADGTVMKLTKPADKTIASLKRKSLGMLADRRYGLRVQTRMNCKFILVRKQGAR